MRTAYSITLGFVRGQFFRTGRMRAPAPGQLPNRGQAYVDVSKWPYAAGRHTSLALELKESDVPGPW